MKKLIAVILLLALLLTLPAGCGKKEEKDSKNSKVDVKDKTEDEKEGNIQTSNKDYLIWNIGSEPKTLDPALNNASDGGHVIENTFEGLLLEDGEKVVPGQAESYEVSDDGLVYTFHLRKDIKWSDGKPVVAADFEYAFKRVCAKETASEYSFIMAPYIKNGDNYLKQKCSADEVGVKAVDEKTLQITLNFPCSYFVKLLSFYTYMPVRQDIIEKYGEAWYKNAESFVCNGPFKLEEFKAGEKIVLKKNENYYNAANVKLAGIEGLMITENTTALNAYRAGDIQVNETIPNNEIPTLKAEDPNFHIESKVGTYYAVFNCDKEPFNDVRVRKAFTLAIDRKLIVEQVSKAGEIPATGFIPPNLSYSDGTSCRNQKDGKLEVEFDIDPYAARIEEAKKLLADAGYPDGKGFPEITYLYNTDDNHQKIGEAIQEMFKNNLGIKMELKNEEWAVFQDTRKDGNFTIARAGWIGDYPEPMTMLDLFTSYSGNNDAQWRWDEQKVLAPHDKTLNPENKLFDEAVKKAMITTGAEKDKNYKEAEKVLMDNYILMPIYYYTDKFVVDEAKVEGVSRTMMGHWIFRDAKLVD